MAATSDLHRTDFTWPTRPTAASSWRDTHGGTPKPADFTLDENPVPVAGPGQVLLRNLVLSLDPYMRGLMDGGGPTYAPSFALGEPLGGGMVA